MAVTDFHCVVSQSDDLMQLPEQKWPAAFPRLGKGWVLSRCGRIALRAGDQNALDQRESIFRAVFGRQPNFDLTIDLLDDTLILERGHLGRTCVYFFNAGSLTLITNRLPDLLTSVECRINYGSAIHYLSYGTPLPGQALVDGVQALRAGHSVKLTPTTVPALARTFEVLSNTESPAPDASGIAAIANAVDSAIIRSCEGSDGAALLLSAGIDSSYMATVLGERLGACYTSHFPDLANAGEFDEARRFSRMTGQTHHAVPIRIADARSGLERILNAEEPKSAWSTIVHDQICQVVAANGHVQLLSGLGADEVFGGYFQYARSFQRVWQQALRVDPAHVRNPLEVILGSPRWYRERLFTGIPSFFDEKSLRSALLPPWRYWDRYQNSVHFYLDILSRKPDLHLFEAMIAHEAQHRVPDLLISGFETFSRDRGLISEFPFLNPEVLRKGAALGANLRFRRDSATGTTENKLLWREIASRRLPDFVMNRLPSAYDAPIHDWFADGAFLDTVCDAISLPSLLDLGLLSRAWINNFINDLRRCRDTPDPQANSQLAEQAWALATFSAWQDRMLDMR